MDILAQSGLAVMRDAKESLKKRSIAADLLASNRGKIQKCGR
jgi:hypothetical protein